MRIADVMTTDLPSLTPDENLRTAALRMTESARKALPVIEEEQLIGVITDWDVTRAVAAHGEDCQVSDFMSTDLVEAGPDTTLSDAAELMGRRHLHHLLVSEDGRFRGIVHLDVEWNQFGGETQAPMATFTAPV